MDNITHSLIGATFAELALPAGASRSQRRAFLITGIIAANLPDADLIYTGITPPPLGSLLHHRGHTHTIGGLVLLVLLFGVVALLPAVRRTMAPVRTRWWALVLAGLVSHLVLDSWNSYGVHPFWPFNSRWFYGDAVFILDPWIWFLLAVPVALNAMHRRNGVLLGALLAVIVALAGWQGAIPMPGVIALCVGAALLLAVMWRWPVRRRAGAAIVLTVLYVAAMFGVRERARARVLAANVVADARTRVVDVVLSPLPANPLCWSVVTITSDASRDSSVTSRGTVSPIGNSGCGRRESPVTWDEIVRQSLATLRDRYTHDCWARAWLQFGRAPELTADAIVDLRYGGNVRPNFTRMTLEPPGARACPANLTHWIPPRADLLAAPS